MDDISGKEQSKKERLMALLVAISLTRQGNLFEDVRRLIQKELVCTSTFARQTYANLK